MFKNRSLLECTRDKSQARGFHDSMAGLLILPTLHIGDHEENPRCVDGMFKQFCSPNSRLFIELLAEESFVDKESPLVLCYPFGMYNPKEPLWYFARVPVISRVRDHLLLTQPICS